MKRILIFGPLNDHGGREIECAYLYRIFKNQFDVTVVSSERMSRKNSLLQADASTNLFARPIPGLISKLLNKVLKRTPVTADFLNLPLHSFQNQPKQCTAALITNSDLVIILAQITSAQTKHVITLALEKNIPVVFRTTGTIPKITEVVQDGVSNLDFIRHTSMFLHHSKSNAERLSSIIEHDYELIDQCIYHEELLKPRSRTKILKFCYAGRLDENKNVKTIISAFDKLKHPAAQLHIFGEGELMNELKKQAEVLQVVFHGQVSPQNIMAELNGMDCMILASFEEAGPYSGLEAMALGIPVISTKVGAMPERLGEDYNYWFEPADIEKLTELMKKMTELSASDISAISDTLRSTYQSRYRSEIIEERYLKAVQKQI